MFKAFLIDPIARTVREIQVNPSLREIYALLSSEKFKVRVIESLHLDKGAHIYIDEEGKLKGPRGDMFWMQGTYFGKPCEWDVVGRGLILGPADSKGDETDAPFTLAEVEAMVRFN